jgi:hypothetical protein
MTWEIVLGLIALVGAVISITTPLLKLNTSITRLNCSIDNLNTGMEKSDERITCHGKQIDDHEHRITILETYHDGRERDAK